MSARDLGETGALGVLLADAGNHVGRKGWPASGARRPSTGEPWRLSSLSEVALALAAGMPIDFVSRQMGHTDIRTRLRFYARYIPALEERHLAMLNEGWRAAGDGQRAEG